MDCLTAYYPVGSIKSSVPKLPWRRRSIQLAYLPALAKISGIYLCRYWQSFVTEAGNLEKANAATSNVAVIIPTASERCLSASATIVFDTAAMYVCNRKS